MSEISEAFGYLVTPDSIVNKTTIEDILRIIRETPNQLYHGDDIPLKKVYLGVSYSGMEESSFHQANEATSLIVAEGINVFSPITHSHSLTKFGTAGDWGFWSKIDYQFLDWSDEAWFLIPEEGMIKLLQSTGVCAEITYAKTHKKPVKFVHKVGNKIVEYGS